MSLISNYISEKNNSKEKILSVFLTAGYPDKNNFVKLALDILEAGADMLEIGFPFSDPLADGPIIQHSSQTAIDSGMNLHKVLLILKEIRQNTKKPLILMGYANPILSYGKGKFATDAITSGANGIIIPDIPIEEYDGFFDSNYNPLDKILLITPTTTQERIKTIDKMSNGFVYCVSVSGTTGKSNNKIDGTIKFLNEAYSLVTNNKMLIGFGISSRADIKTYSPYCDGVIVGSAVIKSLKDDSLGFSKTLNFISNLKEELIAI